jgi:nitrate reductase / nitrite oxidoreductase, alpha subunit
MHTDQWRFDGYSADALASPLAEGHLAGMHTADTIAQSARLGWMPFYPQFNINPLDLADQAKAAVNAGDAPDVASYVANAVAAGTIKMSIEDVDAPENWPRTLTLWRSNLFGSSAKGNEYFLKYLLGTHSNVMVEEGAAQVRPQDVAWHEEPPEGKLDLLLSADFRMTSTTLLSDIVLPAATWYEKYDLSSTDMHPFVHAFTPGHRPAMGGQERLRDVPSHRPGTITAGRHAPRQPTRPGRRSDAARHSRRDGTAAWSRAGLEARRCPRRAGHNDAQLPDRRTRLHRHR